MRRIWSFAATLALVSSPVCAETVKIYASVGGDKIQTGQGWLFTDPTSKACGVVTAAHVVAPDGRPAAVKVLRVRDKKTDEGVGEEVRVLSPEEDGLDVALVLVTGTIAADGCTTSLLGYDSIEDLADRPRAGVMEWIGDRVSETAAYNVQISVRNTDHPERLAVALDPAAGEVQGGYSGTPVTGRPEDQRVRTRTGIPIAMITSVSPQTRLAGAVRFDAIARLVRAALASRARPAVADPKASRTAISVLRTQGSTTDPACPPAQMLGAGHCGWKASAAPGQRLISFDLQTAGDLVAGVRLTVVGGPPGGVGSIEVAATPADDFTYLRPIQLGPSPLSAAFAETRSKIIRIIIPASEDAKVEIKNVSLF